jgi:hypothetical protein
MKKILFLGMLLNIAIFNIANAFHIKISPMGGLILSSVKSDITAYEVLEIHGLARVAKKQSGTGGNLVHNAIAEPLFPRSEFTKDAEASMKKNTAGTIGLFFNVEAIQIEDIKTGFLGGISLYKINALKKPEAVEMDFNSESLNGFFAGYISYAINKKIDAIMGVGASLIKGEYKIIIDKQHPIHAEVHNDSDYEKQYNAKLEGIEEHILKTNRCMLLNLLFGIDFHLNEKISLNTMCIIALPSNLTIDNQENDKQIFANKKLVVSSAQFLVGLTYKLL